jgi:hypothetical protein
MIVYQLACELDHYFEGWFASAEACEVEAASGRLQCPTCGAQSIRKIPAAPHVHTSGSRAPAVPDEQRLRAMVKAGVTALVRRHILENTEDVGREFPEVARRIHYREEEERAIRGRATLAEALELHEEGIDARVLPAEVLSAEEIH